MNQEINNQTTLFRFVSLRSAELTKKEKQKHRFVFHPDDKTGIFFTAVNGKTTTQTKWESMQSIITNFAYLKDEKEVEVINQSYYQLADWLSQNKSNFSSAEFYCKIKGLNPLDLKIELNLWDNLFYQVLNQKSFYVKESIIQLLVFNNILKQITSFKTEAEIIDALPILAQAKVVLPIILFEENAISSNNNNTNQKLAERETEFAGLVPHELLEAKEIAEAKITTENTEFLLSELENIEKSHSQNYEEAYNREFKAYQEQIKPTIVEYQKKYKEEQRRLCEKPKDENYNPDDICNQPNVEYPDLPEFVFDFSQEPDVKSLQKQLSEDSFTELSNLVDLKKSDIF